MTSPAIPDLITEGDTIEEALANVADALRVVREIYEDRGAPLRVEVIAPDQPVTVDAPVSAA